MHFTAVIFWVFSGSEAGRAAKPRLPMELLYWRHGYQVTHSNTRPPGSPSDRPFEYFSSLLGKVTSHSSECKRPHLSSQVWAATLQRVPISYPRAIWFGFTIASHHYASKDLQPFDNFPQWGTLLLQTLSWMSGHQDFPTVTGSMYRMHISNLQRKAEPDPPTLQTVA